MLAAKRRARAGDVLSTSSSESAGHDLEPLDRVGPRFEQAQQRRARPAGLSTPSPGDRARRDRRHQPQRGRGDDAERAFGADQQLVEAVAAIVLLEARQAVVDRAVGQHRLDPRDQRAHRPEAQHLRAAGIGRDQPADGAAAARARASAGSACPTSPARVVEIGEDHPRFGDREPGLGADRADAVHPPQRQDQRRAVRGRRRARRPSPVLPPCGTSGTPMLGRQRDDRRDLFGRGRARGSPARRHDTRPRQSVSHGSISRRVGDHRLRPEARARTASINLRARRRSSPRAIARLAWRAHSRPKRAAHGPARPSPSSSPAPSTA